MIVSVYTKALRYEVQVTCCSPLYTSGFDQGEGEILRYYDGTAFLQGTSLAGAMRDWRPDEKLFGKLYVPGSLIVSDLVFDKSDAMTSGDSDDYQLAVRPHIRINAEKGTPNGKNFFTTALEVGTTGRFTLVWRGNGPVEEAAKAIEPYLAALHHGQIHLGSEKHNGYGRVRLEVTRRTYDLCDRVDREDWLEGIGGGKTVVLEKERNDDVIFHVTAQMPIVRTKATMSYSAGKNQYVQSVPVRRNNQSVIPASSIKGTMRSQMQRIAKTLGADGTVEEMMGAWGVAGKLYFSDGTFVSPERERVHNRIPIDRFTGGLITGRRACDQTTGGVLQWQVCVPGGAPKYCALVLFALRDLGLGLYTLGDGSARGWGFAESLSVRVETSGGTAALQCTDGSVKLEDPYGITAGWIRELKEVAAG